MRLLAISPHFAPVNAPDAQRLRMALPYLIENGCDVTVLAAEPERSGHPIEPDLESRLPPEATVRRLPVSGIAARFGVRNLGWRVRGALWRAMREEIARKRPDLIFFTTTQFAVLPLLLEARWRFGVPSVVDLQDLWWNDFYSTSGQAPPGGWKYRFAHAYARACEGPTLKRSAGLVSVSAAYPEILTRRYPWMAHHPSAVIPFGASLRDLEASTPTPEDSQPLEVLYTGRLGQDLETALGTLFRGQRQCEERSPDVAPQFRFRFLGTSYAATASPTAPRLAREAGVRAEVVETPKRLAYFESLRRMQGAGVTLLLGSDDAGYAPSKIYHALLANRPVLAIVRPDSELEKLLHEIGLPAIVPCDRSGAERVAAWLRVASEAPNRLRLSPDAHAAFAARYSAEATTRHLLRFFESLLP